MKHIFGILTCSWLLTFNLIHAFQHVKPETTNNDFKNFGPNGPRVLGSSQYGRLFERQPTYGLREYDGDLERLIGQQQQQQQPQQRQPSSRYYSDRLESFDIPFQSLLQQPNSNQILIDPNVQERFSKYKNSRAYFRQQPLLDRFLPSRDDLNKLLVTIQSIQPSNEERLMENPPHPERLQLLDTNVDDNNNNNNNGRVRQNFRQQTQQKQTRQYPADDNLNVYDGNTRLVSAGKIASSVVKSSSERNPSISNVYSEENMVIPYDEIGQQENGNNDDGGDVKPQSSHSSSSSSSSSTSTIMEHPNEDISNDNDNDHDHLTIMYGNGGGGSHQPVASMMLKNSHMVRSPKAAYRKPNSFMMNKINNNNNYVDSAFRNLSDIYFIATVVCVSTVAIFSVIGAGYCFYRVQQSNKSAADVDFPSYGVIGPASRSDANLSPKCTSPSNDRKLVQSAQIYHYHHQKQQMISTEKNSNVPKASNNGSDIESDEENEDGEYTVYECPGLAPTGEMEIKNPLFHDDLTPMSSPSVNGSQSASKSNTPKGGGDNANVVAINIVASSGSGGGDDGPDQTEKSQ